MDRKEEARQKRMKNLVSFQDRTPEEMKEILRRSAETRRKKKNESLALQKCMKELLTMRTNSNKGKEVLRKFGFSDEDLTNKVLLMVALFQKGISGDVGAIREITQMMDRLDVFENTGKVTGNVTINLVPTGEPQNITAEEEQEILEAENNEKWMDEDENDEWGMDICEV